MPEKDYQRMNFAMLHNAIQSQRTGLADLVNECRIAGVVRVHSDELSDDGFCLYLVGNTIGADNASFPARFRPKGRRDISATESALRAAAERGLRVRILGQYCPSPSTPFRIDEFSLLEEAGAPRFRGENYQE